MGDVRRSRTWALWYKCEIAIVGWSTPICKFPPKQLRASSLSFLLHPGHQNRNISTLGVMSSRPSFPLSLWMRRMIHMILSAPRLISDSRGRCVAPVGIVTVTLVSCPSWMRSIRWPTGRNTLNPWIREGCPMKRFEMRSMVPGASILQEYLSNVTLERILGKF